MFHFCFWTSTAVTSHISHYLTHPLWRTHYLCAFRHLKHNNCFSKTEIQPKCYTCFSYCILTSILTTNCLTKLFSQRSCNLHCVTSVYMAHIKFNTVVCTADLCMTTRFDVFNLALLRTSDNLPHCKSFSKLFVFQCK